MNFISGVKCKRTEGELIDGCVAEGLTEMYG